MTTKTCCYSCREPFTAKFIEPSGRVWFICRCCWEDLTED